MCITPKHAQQTVIFRTFNPLLPAVLLICLIPLGSAQCPPGQFFHFNLATYKGVCCITVPLPAGYGFKSCEVNGTPDSIEKCPEGLYQPDNTTTESETTCSKEFECNPEEHLKVPGCESGQDCGSTCICNYEKGYCGKFSYDCKKFPKDCPSELVQKDCSCKRDPPRVTSLSPGNGSNILTNTTMPSTAPRDGGARNKPGGGVDTNNGTANTNGSGNVPDTNNGTANTNGTGNVPDQTQSTDLNAAVIAIGIVFAVGLVAIVILVYIFSRRLKKWLSKYRNFCLNRSTNSEEVIFVKRKQDGQGKEAEPFLTEVRSEGGCDNQKNLMAGQSEVSSIQAGVTVIQSLVVDNGGSEGCYGSQNNPAGGQSDEGSTQAGGANMQSPVIGTEGSKGFCGDQKNPAGDFHSDGGRSVQDGITSIQSLVADDVKTEDCDNGSFFCKCCNLPSSRCRKKKKDIPVGKVNGTRQTAQFLEMPSTGYVGSEMSVDGFVSFTSSINHDVELHDTTNTVDEETTFLKPVNNPEVADSDDQVLSIVQQRNEVERSRFEDSQQADFSDESHVHTGMPAGEGLYRTDSGVRNQDEVELIIENEEDVEEE